MPKENNKMQVDIDTLKKQNVNDLLSIKELYKRIEDLGEKITQIKNIDNTLVKKLKKEYEKLKKIILDENIQFKLTNDIETINSQLDTMATLKLDKSIIDYKDMAGYDNAIYSNLTATLMLSNGYTIEQYKARIDDLYLNTKVREISIGVTMIAQGTTSTIQHGSSSPSILNILIPYMQNKGFKIISVRNMLYSTPIDKETYTRNMKPLLIELSQCIKSYGIKTLFISNEQKTITNENKNVWSDIISSLKNLGITTGVSLASFGQEVCFLDLIDIIAYNFYIGLSDITSKNTNEEILQKFKETFLGGYTTLCEIKDTYNKPMVITEFGCGNREKSMGKPTQTENTGNLDLIAQKKYLEVASTYFGQLNYKGQAIFDYLYIWLVAIDNDSQYDFTRNPYALETVEKLIRNKIKIKEIDIDNVNSIANNFSTTFSSLNLYKFVIDQLVEQNMRIREIEQQLYIINKGR